jgi:hypothetical protein
MSPGSTSPILVYQMGKVGSTSVMATLKHVPGLEVHQVHRLSAANVARVRDWPDPPGDEEGLRLSERLIRPGAPLRIVTLVREPIGRNISYFFQNLDKICNTPAAHEVIPIETLVRRYQIEFPYSDDPLSWFDYEFREVLGIDVYSTAFDHAAGFQAISNATCNVLILRTDLPDTTKARVLSEFLDLAEPIALKERANVTRDKTQSAAYHAFLKSIRMLPEYVDGMFGSRFAQHFFDTKTREHLRKAYLEGGSIVPDAFLERWPNSASIAQHTAGFGELQPDCACS